MSVRHNLFSRFAILGIFAAVFSAAGLRSAQASTLVINPALSSINVVVSVGLFVDGQGNTANPDTPDVPYGPGDLGPGPDPDDPTQFPVTFGALGSSVGQTDPGSAGFVAPGGAVSVFGDGSSAQLNGTISVTPAGFQINSAAIGLNVSGAYQPTNTLDTNAPPTPSELGVTIDLNNVIGGAYAVARLNGTTLSIGTGPVSLDGGGNFSDPNGVVNLLSSNVIGFAGLPAGLGGPQALNTTITNQLTNATIAGTYSTLGPVQTLNIPNLIATTYVSAGSSLPGFYIALTQTANIVATAVVPEPSTMILAGFGLVGLCFASYRRVRK